MTDGDHVRNRRPTTTPVASARLTLCRLSASGPWLWLVRLPAVEAAPTHALVLLHGLPRVLVAVGEGGPGHG